MNTIEEKRLIATFMNYAGGKPLTDGLLHSLYNDWNSIMPVIEKIELMNKETGCMGVFTFFGLGHTKISCYKKEMLMHEINIMDESYGMMPTYDAVVKFIQWYDKQKEK